MNALHRTVGMVRNCIDFLHVGRRIVDDPEEPLVSGALLVGQEIPSLRSNPEGTHADVGDDVNSMDRLETGVGRRSRHTSRLRTSRACSSM